MDKNQIKALLCALNDENEEKAIAIYFSVDSAARSLELDMHPSLPIGHNENSPLHLAGAAHASNLVKIFIDHGGSPNTTNGSNQTCLHASCGGIEKENKGIGLGSIVMGMWGQVAGRNQEVEDTLGRKQYMQLECVDFLLNWQGLEIDGESEKPLVNAGINTCFKNVCATSVTFSIV